MKHRVATDEIRDLAAAYSLGALEPAEARMFEEHLTGGCQICGAELEGFSATVSALGLSAAEQEPPHETRSALLSMLNGDHKLPSRLRAAAVSLDSRRRRRLAEMVRSADQALSWTQRVALRL